MVWSVYWWAGLLLKCVLCCKWFSYLSWAVSCRWQQHWVLSPAMVFHYTVESAPRSLPYVLKENCHNLFIADFTLGKNFYIAHYVQSDVLANPWAAAKSDQRQTSSQVGTSLIVTVRSLAVQRIWQLTSACGDKDLIIHLSPFSWSLIKGWENLGPQPPLLHSGLKGMNCWWSDELWGWSWCSAVRPKK